jgi:heme/copper-type cytochrome/quinol oxidase subunit 3
MQRSSITICDSAETRIKPINPKGLSWVLGGITLLLAVASLACQYLIYFRQVDLSRFQNLLDVDTELSLPTIYSVLLLFSAALLLILITQLKEKEHTAFCSAWHALALGFLFLTLDEGASLHEKLMTPIHNFLGDNIPGYFYFTWVIPALLGVGILALLFLNFLKSLPQKTGIGFTLAGIVYVGGAVGIELVSGAYASRFGLDNFTFNLLATIEETLEMSGLVLFIRTLLGYIPATYPGLRVWFNRGRS